MFQPTAIPVCNTKRIIPRVVRTKEQVAGNEWNGFRGRGADGLHGLCVRIPRDWEWAPFRGKGNFAGETILGYPGGLRGTPRALMGSRQEGQGQRVRGRGRTDAPWRAFRMDPEPGSAGGPWRLVQARTRRLPGAPRNSGC